MYQDLAICNTAQPWFPKRWLVVPEVVRPRGAKPRFSEPIGLTAMTSHMLLDANTASSVPETTVVPRPACTCDKHVHANRGGYHAKAVSSQHCQVDRQFAAQFFETPHPSCACCQHIVCGVRMQSKRSVQPRTKIIAALIVGTMWDRREADDLHGRSCWQLANESPSPQSMGPMTWQSACIPTTCVCRPP